MSGPSRRLLGAVLAGGISSRFGSPKWSVPVAGQTMGERALAALGPNVEQVVAISADPAVASLGVEVRADVVAGQGPLGGIRTALEWATELGLDGVIVLACDLPLVSAPLIGRLCSVWKEEEIVFPVTPAGAEPLCALYAASMLHKVQAALARGELSPSRLMRELETHSLDIEVARRMTGLDDPFLNVNTRDARDIAESQLLAGRTSLAAGRSRHHM